MSTIITRLLFMAVIIISVTSCKQAYDISAGDMRLAESGRLDRTKYAVVVASGRFYTRHFLMGVVQRPLAGNFYLSSKKPGPNNAPTTIIKDGFMGANIYRVTLVPEGTWVMRNWYSVQANSYGYNTISSKERAKPWGKFTVKAGDVVYIGNFVIRAYEEENKKIVPFAIDKNMQEAKKALAGKYPRLAGKLVYRPMKLTP